ncbi:enkurin [Leptinotarsa decemlineata]|uniref:enkurin n=1 Tax=Leptinotarsa decemlineata TaxID=7539 RepID=UPI000C255B85|nr:enkurin [Leptinotarsa decemlineata]
MSVILITKHDENIYNITKSQADFKQKSPPYKSKFRDKTKEIHKDYKKCVKLHATMGRPEEDPPDPANFLRKHTGKPSYTHCKPPKESKPCEHLPHRDKVPTLEEIAKVENQQKEEKNFVHDNIQNITKMKAKEPVPKVVVDRVGTSKPLKPSLEPVYIKLPRFGRTPKYLVRFIQAKEKEYQMKKDASGVQQPLCKYITRDEREKLLNGLKQNWEELQKQYQGLPILTDTIPKKIRKSKIESDLKQLEKDIVLLERHPYIYVYDDSDTS